MTGQRGAVVYLLYAVKSMYLECSQKNNRRNVNKALDCDAFKLISVSTIKHQDFQLNTDYTIGMMCETSLAIASFVTVFFVSNCFHGEATAVRLSIIIVFHLEGSFIFSFIHFWMTRFAVSLRSYNWNLIVFLLYDHVSHYLKNC